MYIILIIQGEINEAVQRREYNALRYYHQNLPRNVAATITRSCEISLSSAQFARSSWCLASWAGVERKA